jgi:gliding motility-associated-like protein
MKRFILFCLFSLSVVNVKAQCWKEVSVKGSCSAGIKMDGTLWVWGSLRPILSSLIFTSVLPIQLGTATNWKTLSVNNNHIMAIQTNGTLWGIGDNSYGQLGNGTTINSNTLIQIGTATNWENVVTGNYHTIVLTTNGTLWSWGDNTYGQLGDGTTVGRTAPAQIGTDTDWQSVSAFWEYGVSAIKTNGTLWVWGSDLGNGYLGLGPAPSSAILPTQLGTDTDWKSVSIGSTHTLALKTNGTLWACGVNNQGQLGDGTYLPKFVLTQIGTDTDWQTISAGHFFSEALKTSGTLWTWGYNTVGQLGNSASVTFTNVIGQIGTATHWKSICAGTNRAFVIATNGSLWGWGAAAIGDGSAIDKNYPVNVGGVTTLSVTVNASSLSLCAGSPVTLTGSGATSYTWTGGISNGVPFIPASSGNYIVTGSDVNGCYNTATVAITVNPNTTVTANATSTNVCTGGTVTLTGSGAGSYVWSNGVTNGVSFTQLLTTTYTVTDATGCSNTASITVSVLPLPVVSVNNASICAGSNALLTASVNPVSGTTYNWSSASTSSSLTVSPTVNSSYTVTVTNNGCSASAVASVSVIPVIVPVTGFLYPTPLCITASNPLPIGAAGFSPGGSYSSGTGIATDPASGLIDLSNSTAGTYIVTYSVAANGCNPSASSTATITLNPPTAAVTDFSYLPVCSNDANPSPFLNPNFTAGGNFSGSGLALNAGSGVVNLANTTPGTYTITYNVNAANCVLAGTGTASVLINPAPVLSLSSSTTIIAGEQTTLTASSSATTYTWFPAINLTCSDCAAPVASPNESTTYCVRTSDGVCANSACVTVIVESLCEGDKGFFLPNAFSPNNDGNNDVFCVQGRNRCVSNFQMIVYDRWGEKVFESGDLSSCWDGTYRGKVLGPDVFVYYIKAKDQNQKEVIKKGNVSLVK